MMIHMARTARIEDGSHKIFGTVKSNRHQIHPENRIVHQDWPLSLLQHGNGGGGVHGESIGVVGVIR